MFFPIFWRFQNHAKRAIRPSIFAHGRRQRDKNTNKNAVLTQFPKNAPESFWHEKVSISLHTSSQKWLFCSIVSLSGLGEFNGVRSSIGAARKGLFSKDVCSRLRVFKVLFYRLILKIAKNTLVFSGFKPPTFKTIRFLMFFFLIFLFFL